MNGFKRCLFCLLIIAFSAHAESYSQLIDVKRERDVLLNQYYHVKPNDPIAAKKALDLLQALYPNDETVLKEMGYWYLNQKNFKEALSVFQKAYRINPNDENLSLQIGYLLAQLKQNQAAIPYFQKVVNSSNPEIQQKAKTALTNLLPALPAPAPVLSAPMPILPPPNIQVLIVPFAKPALSNPLNEYYQLKKTDPAKAKILLEKIIASTPNNNEAWAELGYLHLSEGDKKAAITDFEKAYQIATDEKLALQIGYLYYAEQDNVKALYYFEKAAGSQQIEIKQKALAAVKVIQSAQQSKTANKATLATLTKPSPQDPLSLYYELKKTDPQKAEALLKQLVIDQPCNMQALKELGYLYVEQKNYADAYDVFNIVFFTTYDYAIATQLGYVAEQLGQKRMAYLYFEMAATHSDDAKIRLQSNLAMTNLSGFNSRVMEYPYFADIYVTPFYYSRFDLGVVQLNARLGVRDKSGRTELYFGLRATRDDQTTASGISPQIFEDNIAVLSAGLRRELFKDFPLFLFGEAGITYDLIYQNTSRWQGDLRGGLTYFDRWGLRPTYTDELNFPFKIVTDAYGDFIYYSRYADSIGSIRVRPGLRVAQYHSSYIDVYVRGFTVFDTQQQFYNNIAEVGPGIVFVPSNRFNFAIRYERNYGFYIPVDSPSPNPYGPRYNYNMLLAELYARF